eukprot:gb/GEZN01005767.1/.p1 GENE.gb/GEZN01005767.1/~~gb/GEZN01005767.1/.p1  ORF type:complete len:494 (+),score=62.01 gb/GEZN01005767.1/:43-1524(+)
MNYMSKFPPIFPMIITSWEGATPATSTVTDEKDGVVSQQHKPKASPPPEPIDLGFLVVHSKEDDNCSPRRGRRASFDEVADAGQAGNAAPIVRLSDQNVQIIQGKAFTFKGLGATLYAEKGGEGQLRLFTAKVKTDSNKRYKQAYEAMMNEIKKREEELLQVDETVRDLHTRAESGEQDVELGAEIVRLLGVAGQHKRRLKELKELTHIQFEFEERQDRREVVLSPGVLSNVENLVPGLSRVVWYQPEAWSPPRLSIARNTRKFFILKNAKITDPFSPTWSFVETKLSPQLQLSKNNQKVVKTSEDVFGSPSSIFASSSTCLGSLVRDGKVFTYTVRVTLGADFAQGLNLKSENNEEVLYPYNIMLGWAPASMKSESNAELLYQSGLYVAVRVSEMHNGTGTNLNADCGDVSLLREGKWEYFGPSGLELGIAKLRTGDLLISKLDEEKRTISLQLPGQSEPAIAFKDVPLGMQPAFFLYAPNAAIEFISEAHK